jgi:general secretion pathway protein K
MALVAVLWIVAALSILVIGVSTTVRQQIQLVGLQRDAVRAGAAGEPHRDVVQQLGHVQPAGAQREGGLVELGQVAQ